MRFLVFTLEFPPFKGGVAEVYESLCKNWPEPENIFVLNNNNGKLISRILPRYRWLPSVWRLWTYVRLKKIDHVIVGHILPLGISAYLVSKITKIKYSIYLHGMDYNYAFKTERKSWIVNKILAGAEYIICANSYVAAQVKEEQGEKCAKKLIVSNPTVAGRKINRELAEKLKAKHNLENKTILLSISRQVKRKGFDYVVESLPEILAGAPDLVYVIGGIGPDEEYIKEKWMALPGEAKNKVIFIGKPTDEEKWAWLSLGDIFIMPSRKINGGDVEGFGIVYLEANLAGKPVIAGDSGGVKDAVANNISGLLVNPDEKSEIVAAVIRLANDKELCRSLGEKGRQRVLNDFEPKKRIMELYEILTAKK